MKGFLRSSEGLYQLMPDVTTVGREGCDIAVQNHGVGSHHAIINYDNETRCFLLKDLNTRNGTYINNCLVQNVSVRLAAGDVIRFGYSGIPYELVFDDPDQIMYPSPKPVRISPKGGRNGEASSPRSRVRRSSSNDHRSGSCERSSSQGAQQAQYFQRNSHLRESSQNGSADKLLMNGESQDEALAKLNSEIRRLSFYESECREKEQFIQRLKSEIAHLHSLYHRCQARAGDSGLDASPDGASPDGADDSDGVRWHSSADTNGQPSMPMVNENIGENEQDGAGGRLSNASSGHDRLTTSPWQQVKDLTKEKAVLAGLVNQMERDMADKDTTICRLARENASLKREAGERDALILALQAMFRKIDENQDDDDEFLVQEKELANLKKKMKCLESRLNDFFVVNKEQKSGLEKVQEMAGNKQVIHTKTLNDLALLKTKCEDVERAERVARQEVDKINRRWEKFRTRIVQLLFSIPGSLTSNKQMDDEDILDAVKSMLDEKMALLKPKAAKSPSKRQELPPNSQ